MPPSLFDRGIEVGVPWSGKARQILVAEPEAWSWPCSLCPCIFLSDIPLKRDPGGPEQHQEEERESSDAPGQTSHSGCVYLQSQSSPACCGHLGSSNHRSSSRMCCPEPPLGFTHWGKKRSLCTRAPGSVQ